MNTRNNKIKNEGGIKEEAAKDDLSADKAECFARKFSFNSTLDSSVVFLPNSVE